ncbi:LacI family DNA-binding transcriptional regulator [uncultured Roseobacter sp.]|uniref:LacI family DNA-binding transcriptional regulator n=1 Tax=uncultured Roseobacter sp. TaxID=114847 RepID=UPI00261DD1B2|nr:LacI family DNA-binding transcriptional regulator [uncultured Roseobacter sp.]
MSSGKTAAPTMDDIATEAGVSQMTVSRVMRGAGKTSDDVRVRVEKAARKLGYVQNKLASALREETTSLVAVVLPTLKNRVFSEVLNGLNETLISKRILPVFGVSEYSLQREEEIVRELLAWRPRGIVLPGLEHTDATRAAIRASGVRVAEVMDIDGTPMSAAFGISQEAAGRATARYMLEKGYRRFGYIGSQGGRDLRAVKRFSGFCAVVREAGAQMVLNRVITGPSSMVEGRRAMAEVLARSDAPEALYFSNDDLAAGGIMHCLSNGIDIPGQVALAGFNGLSFLEALPIRLTTIETPRLEMGRRAALSVTSSATAQDGSQEPVVADLGFRLVPGDSC